MQSESKTKVFTHTEFAKIQNSELETIFLSGLNLGIISEIWDKHNYPVKIASKELIDTELENLSSLFKTANKYILLLLLESLQVICDIIPGTTELTERQNKALFDYIANIDEVRAVELRNELNNDFSSAFKELLNFWHYKFYVLPKQSESYRSAEQMFGVDSIALSENMQRYSRNFSMTDIVELQNFIFDIQAGKYKPYDLLQLCEPPVEVVELFTLQYPVENRSNINIEPMRITDIILPKLDLLQFLETELQRLKFEADTNTQSAHSELIEATQSPNNGIEKDFTYLSVDADKRYSFVFEETDLQFKHIANAIGFLVPKLGIGLNPNFSKKSYETVLSNELFQVSLEQKKQIKNQLRDTLFAIGKNIYPDEPINQRLFDELYSIIDSSKRYCSTDTQISSK